MEAGAMMGKKPEGTLMRLNDMINAICTELKSCFPSLTACEPHGGPIDAQELDRIAASAPAIYVAALATEKGREVGSGEVDTPVSLTAYVVTADSPSLSRADAALNLMEGLLARIAGATWGCDGVQGVDSATAENLFTADLDLKGLAMWAVSWKQTVRLGDDVWQTDLPFPSQLYVGMSPNVGDGHEGDYRRMEVDA